MPATSLVNLPPNFATRLLDWFDQHGRHDLPWQQPKTPYRVWISEIMLQQTQVATAIPYFHRFISRFPSVDKLAYATTDEVLSLWTGLGYYARARNLHQAAQIIAAEHAGQVPDTLEALCSLPGIGRSTAGAILSLAYGQQASILDGNVRRVLTRLAAIDSAPSSQRERQLWRIATELTPSSRNADYTQAMMDLGATLCRRGQPDCERCPFEDDCMAHRQGIAKQLPVGKKRAKLEIKSTFMLLLKHTDGTVFLQQRPPVGLWGGLWCPPQFDNLEQLTPWLLQHRFESTSQQLGKSFRHSFSHFHLDITPIRMTVTKHSMLADSSNRWVSYEQLHTLGLPAPVKRLLQR